MDFERLTFMAAKKLNRVNKMGMEGGGPSHPRSPDASFDAIDDSCSSFEIAAVDVRLKVVVVVVVSEASGVTMNLMMARIQIHCSKA